MNYFVKFLAILLLASLDVLNAADKPAAKPARPNVLFIIADDASQHFGEAYGCNWAKTPNIDRLAKQGFSLRQRLHADVEVCSFARGHSDGTQSLAA